MSTHVRRRHAGRAVAPIPLGRCALSGKQRWSRRGHARHHLRELKALRDDRHAELGTYRCKDGCGDWHVGHKGAAA